MVRRIALTLNVFLMVSVIWAAIILSPYSRHLPWQTFASQLIKLVAAGTAVITTVWPNGRMRHSN